MLDALEEGRYEQTTQVLRGEDGYCIGGVMCDMSDLGKWELVGRDWQFRVGHTRAKFHRDIPPEVIRHYGMPKSLSGLLIIKNDQRKSFRALATFIRQWMEVPSQD